MYEPPGISARDKPPPVVRQLKPQVSRENKPLTKTVSLHDYSTKNGTGPDHKQFKQFSQFSRCQNRTDVKGQNSFLNKPIPLPKPNKITQPYENTKKHDQSIDSFYIYPENDHLPLKESNDSLLDDDNWEDFYIYAENEQPINNFDDSLLDGTEEDLYIYPENSQAPLQISNNSVDETVEEDLYVDPDANDSSKVNLTTVKSLPTPKNSKPIPGDLFLEKLNSLKQRSLGFTTKMEIEKADEIHETGKTVVPNKIFELQNDRVVKDNQIKSPQFASAIHKEKVHKSKSVDNQYFDKSNKIHKSKSVDNQYLDKSMQNRPTPPLPQFSTRQSYFRQNKVEEIIENDQEYEYALSEQIMQLAQDPSNDENVEDIGIYEPDDFVSIPTASIQSNEGKSNILNICEVPPRSQDFNQDCNPKYNPKDTGRRISPVVQEDQIRYPIQPWPQKQNQFERKLAPLPSPKPLPKMLESKERLGPPLCRTKDAKPIPLLPSPERQNLTQLRGLSHPLARFSWFHPKVNRNTATEILQTRRQEGDFIIRETDKGDGYSISIFHQDSVTNLRVPFKDGYYFLGTSSKEFPSVPDLVNFYQQNGVILTSGGLVTLKRI